MLSTRNLRLLLPVVSLIDRLTPAFVEGLPIPTPDIIVPRFFHREGTIISIGIYRMVRQTSRIGLSHAYSLWDMYAEAEVVVLVIPSEVVYYEGIVD